MSTLSPAQIYSYARGAGFTPSQAITATAVALAESGGNPAAHCLNCFPGVTEDSRGLWQINVDAHTDLKAWNLFDPATNARAAFNVSNGGKSFGPWSTFTQGNPPAYRKFVGVATAASTGDPVASSTVQRSGGSSGTAKATDASALSSAGSVLGLLNPFSWADDVAKAVTAIYDDFKGFALRGIVLTAAGGLFVVGMYRTVQPTVQKVQSQVVDAGETAAAVGALA